MRRVPVLILAHVLAAMPAAAIAQTPADSASATASPADPSGAAIPKGALGPEYVDGSFGFAVRPIAGARIDRRKRTVEGHVQLAQFIRLEVGWSMSVRLWEPSRPVDVQAARDAIKADLLPTYPDFQITTAEAVNIGGRDAVRVAGTFSTEGQMWLRQHLIVPLRTGEHIIVLLATPADDREIATAAFTQIVNSFKIVRTQAQQEELDAALDRGTSLLQRVNGAAQPISTKAATKPIYLRVMRQDKSAGFIEMLEKAGSLDHKQGLQMLQRGWMFNTDGSATYFEESKFTADDGTFGEWRNLSQTMPSKQVDPKQRVVASVESGIRRNDQLVVESVQQVGVYHKQTKAIQISPSYAPSAWPLILPRVVDLNKPEVYAFSMYDPQRRGLILRVLRVAGPTFVQVGGQRTAASKIEDSEGLVPPISEIDVDKNGLPLRLATPTVEMTRTTQAEVEREFGPRIKATQEIFRKNAGNAPAASPAGKAAATPPNPAAQQKTRRTPGH